MMVGFFDWNRERILPVRFGACRRQGARARIATTPRTIQGYLIIQGYLTRLYSVQVTLETDVPAQTLVRRSSMTPNCFDVTGRVS